MKFVLPIVLCTALMTPACNNSPGTNHSPNGEVAKENARENKSSEAEGLQQSLGQENALAQNNTVHEGQSVQESSSSSSSGQASSSPTPSVSSPSAYSSVQTAALKIEPTVKAAVSNLAMAASTPTPNTHPDSDWSEAPLPIKVGLLSDSQMQTEDGQTFIVNSRVTDSFVDLAIRPPVLPLVMGNTIRFFLEKIAQSQPDLIVFIGDAGNNGCKDEIKKVFDSLNDFRNQTQIPVYAVIGNHDFLAEGVLTSYITHIKVCGGAGNVMAKSEAIAAFSNFNQQNAQLKTKLVYSDNYSENPSKVEKGCGPKITLGFKTNFKMRQHQRKDCFGAGIVTDPDKKYSLFLMDSSDYYDEIPNMFERNITVSGIGALSIPQMEWFNTHMDEKNIRFFTFHFPTEVVLNLQSRMKKYPKIFSGKVFPWFTAHTHASTNHLRADKTVKVSDQESSVIQELNIGSTIDYKMSAFNATVDVGLSKQWGLRVGKLSKAEKIDSTILEDFNGTASSCCKIHNKVMSIDVNAMPQYKKVLDKNKGLILMGVTRDYKNIRFNRQNLDFLAIKSNLATFHAESDKDFGAVSIDTCFTYLASLIESKNYTAWYNTSNTSSGCN